jgi:hypothetical protein
LRYALYHRVDGKNLFGMRSGARRLGHEVEQGLQWI